MIRSTHARTWPLAFALATGTLAGCSGPDVLVKVGDGIRHDDFIYRVTSASTHDRIGTRRPAGIYRLIGFAVENHARRVNHLWDNRIGYLVTDDGRSFENDETAQQALERLASFGWKARYVTPAEQRAETTLVFDVPRDAHPLYFKVRGELLMGDVFTFNRYQRTRVRID